MAVSKRFLGPINLYNGSSDPVSPRTGDSYYNTVSKKIRYYDGTSWIDVSNGGSITVSTTAPLSPSTGDAWFNNSDGSLYIWDGTFWQEATSMMEVGLSADPAPLLNADLDANGYGINNADHLEFDTTPTGTAAVGQLQWNDGEGTLDLGLKGGNVVLQLGQENVALCYNGTGSTLTNGTVVYITGAQGQRPTLAKASASSEAASSKTFGIVTEDIVNGAEGFVTTFGIIRGLNTSAFTEGAPIWLATTAGTMTTTKPTPPNHSVFIGYCVRSHESSGQIFVNIQNGYELDELHNVLITTPTDGQVLQYDAATSLWKNATSTGGGGASVSVSDTAPSTPTQGNLWFNSTNGKTYIYFDNFWVEVGGTTATGMVSTDVALSNSWWLGV